MQEIFITNKNDFDQPGPLRRQDFFFPRSERVTIPIIAAQHMFGLGLADKTETLIRLGWNMEGEAGVRKLANFVFTQGVMIEAPVDEKQVSLPLTSVHDEQPAA